MKVTSRQRNKVCAGTDPTPTRGNSRVVVSGCGWSGDGGVMTAGMFGALQSTMEDGAWGVDIRCDVCVTNGVAVVMPLLLLLAC